MRCAIIFSLLAPLLALAQDSLSLRVVSSSLKNWSTSGTGSIAALDGYLYASLGDADFGLFDVSDPANIIELSVVDGDLGRLGRLNIVGSRLYGTRSRLFPDTNGVSIACYNLDDPLHPVALGFASLLRDEHLFDLKVVGDIAFVMIENFRTDQFEIKIFDFADPRQPRLAAVLPGLTSFWDVSLDKLVANKRVYNRETRANDYFLEVFDISDLEQPRRLNHSLGEARRPGYIIRPAGIENGRLFVEDNDTMRVLDVSDTSNVSVIANIPFDYVATFRVLRNNLLYTTDPWGDLSIFDFSDLQNVTRISRTQFAISEASFSLVDQTIYIGSGHRIELIDVSDPTDPQSLGKFIEGRNVHNVVKSGQYGYVLDNTPHDYFLPNEKLRIVDLTDMTAPEEVGSLLFDDSLPSSQAACNGSAFVRINEHRLTTIDVRDPTNPALTGNWDVEWREGMEEIPNSWAYNGAHFRGDSAYLITYLHLGMLDLSDPADPIFSGWLERPRGYCGIAGDHIFIRFQNWLNVYSLDRIDSLTWVGACELPAGWRFSTGAVCNRYIALNIENALKILDITDPTRPILRQETWNFFDDRWIARCYAEDNRLCVETWMGVIEQYDMTDLSNPVFIGSNGRPNAPDDGEVGGIAILGDTIVVANQTSLLVLDRWRELSTPSVPPPLSFIPQLLSLSSFPNPFNSTTTISYSLLRPGCYALSVIDITGREVTKLSEGWRESGSYREVWDGAEVPNGQFILILKGSTVAAKPVTLIK